MGGFLQRIKMWWDGSDRNQRMMAIGGSAFFVLLLVGIFFYASKPKMSLLFGGLSPTQQGSVVTELEKLGIQADFDDRGDVLVPSDKVADARMRLATENKLPTTVGFGDDEISKIGNMNTPAVEKERLKMVLENRLEQSIDSIDGIENSQVSIVLPDTSPFVEEQKPATASVTITERTDANITPDKGRTIALLVANSVPGLSMNGIEVVNSKMQLLYDGKNNNSVDGQVNSKLSTEEEEGKRRAQELQAMLDQVYGPQTTIVKVNLSLDFDDKKYTEVKNTPSDKLETMNIDEKMKGDGANPSGLAGAASNVNGLAGAPATPGASTDGNGYSVSQKQMEYMKNTKESTVVQSAGALNSMAIDVIANSDKVPSPTSIQSVVDGYLGDNLNKPGFTSKVTLVAFDTTASKLMADQAKSEASAQRIQQLISILPIVALLIIGLVVMKQISKLSKPFAFGKSSLQGQSIVLGPNGVPIYTPTLGGASANSNGLIASIGGDGGLNGLENALRGDTLGEGVLPQSDVGNIQTKVNVPLEQIKKMGSQRPEAVANLIKGWVLEERN